MEKLKNKMLQLKENSNPEKILEKFLKWFDNKKRMAFLITLLIGIITHITMITEMIMSQDGLWNSIEYFRPGDWERTLGRWGIALMQRFNFFIAIPTVSTISCILCMAIASVFLVDIFEFKSKISIIFTSLILVLTPTLTATLLYIYTAFAYCANFLISVAIIWFLYKFKYKKCGFCIAILGFVLSLSIYQSYIGVSIGLCVMISALNILKNKKELKDVFIDIGKMILVVLVGAILYLITTRIILNFYDLELTNYQNYANTISVKDILLNLGTSIFNTYKDFLVFFLGDNIIHNSNYRRELFNGALLLISVIVIVFAIVGLKEDNKKKKIQKSILALIFTFCIPIGLNIIEVIIIKHEMYALTACQMILFIPFIFAIFECLDKSVILKWGAILCCMYTMLTYYIAINTSYAALKLTYNQAYSTTMRIMDRIENTDGYNKDLPILFGGIVGNNNYPRTSSLYTYTIGSIVTNTTFHGSYYGATGTWLKFLRIYYGLDVKLCTPEVYYKVVNGDDYKNMEIFPAKDSIKIIDGIVVVKLSDTPDMPY